MGVCVVLLLYRRTVCCYRHANDNINMKDRELKSLRRQLDSTSEDLNENSRAKEVALRENRRLQDDLAVMTRENQVSKMSPLKIVVLYFTCVYTRNTLAVS